MLNLSAESIKDYQTCARLYDYRYQQKEFEPINKRSELSDKFENTLKKVAAFFFYKKQSGYVPSYAALLNRWERIWFPKDMTAYDLLTEQHETAYKNLASYTTEASAALMNFHDKFADDAGEVFFVDENFSIPLTHDIKLSGTFDLVLRYRKQKTFIIMNWAARGKKPIMSNYEMDFSILKHSFDYKTQNVVEYRKIYGIYDLASSTPGFIQSDVGDEDVNALIYWAKEINSDDIYPPRRGLTSYCKVCPFDDICKEWNGWPNATRVNVG